MLKELSSILSLNSINCGIHNSDGIMIEEENLLNPDHRINAD